MKRLSIAMVSMLIIWATSMAQDLIPDQNDKGKWGYVDASGQKVINYDYAEVSAFVDGRAKVRKGDKWGYINPQGKEIIKIEYSEIRTWNGDYCKVAKGGKVEDGLLTSGGKWGYINRNGEAVLKCEYDEIGVFKDGLAYIKKGDKYGYIDSNYKIFIPCKYSAVGSFNPQGFCWVNDGGKFDKSNIKKVIGGKYGVYNRQGELVIEPKYKMIGTFTHTSDEANPYLAKILDTEEYAKEAKKIRKEAWKKRESKTKKGAFSTTTILDLRESQAYADEHLNELMNNLLSQMSQEEYRMMMECGEYNLTAYEFITPEKFSTLDMPLNKYFAVSNNYNEAKQFDHKTARTNKNDKIGIINEQGEIILEPGKYPIVYFPTENFVPVAQEKKNKLQVNYYNIETKKLLFKKWVEASGISPFQDGVAVIINDDTQYLINTTGEKISAEYNFILPPQNGIYIVKRDSYGVVNMNGNEIVAPTYNMILPVSETLMCVQQDKDGLFGYLNCDGEYAIPAKYLDAKSFGYGAALVKTADGWGEIDHNDQKIIECEWEDVKACSVTNPTYSWVKKSGEWFGLDVAKNELKTKGYADVYNFSEDNIAYVSDSSGLIGAINTSDTLIIPCQLSSTEMADKCLQAMKDNGKTTMDAIDVYRFNLMHDDSRNSFRLTEKINSNLWDF